MADLRMRPRFAVDVSCDAETLLATLEENVAQADPPLEADFDRRHCVLRIPAPRRAFWSPELDLTIEKAEPEGSDPPAGNRVRCLFAPRPEVWTGYAFVFAMLGAASLASVLYALAQVSLGESPSALMVIPVAAVLGLLTYASSFIGQGLALAQMYELRRLLEESVERAEQQTRRTKRGYQI